MKTNDEHKTQHSILSHLTESLYHSIPIALSTLFLLASVLIWVLHDVIEKKLLMGWYLGFCSLLILRGFQFLWYRRTKLETRLLKYHYYLFILTSCLTASFLGVLGSFMMPHDVIYQSFIIILVSGVIAGSVQSLAASFLANILYIYLALFPILAWEFIQIVERQEIYIGIFAGMLIFCVFSFFTARREYTTLVKHIDLEYNYKRLLRTTSKMKNLYKAQATHDVLTGLYNRSFLNQYLEIEIAFSKRRALSLAVIILDIDFFKKVNDTYGHTCGDEILKATAEKISQGIRKSDMACRYGGEEFLVILSDITQEGAKHVAEVLRKAIKTISIQKQSELVNGITASFGIAIFPQHGVTKEELIEAADNALYQAKKEGRDRIYSA
jgi:diguanylate cyclase (GGDEF)-like protein